ncbi:MAG: phenylalanine--tRNA ligase subunit beta [Pelolinea sp.]|nr:phenylalanine--tRNA ligase subunit beta [Pelolinea sp.]
MELVYSWLKDYVNISHSLIELGQALTMLGMEVEDVRLVGLPAPTEHGGISFHGLEWDRNKIVVARVDEVLPHPNADRLVLCRLNDGREEFIVLTGAPNLFKYKSQGPLAEPLKVPYAREGARLYDGHKPGRELMTLKRMTIRGVESFSMICSEKELGISDEHEGIILLDDDAPVGMPLVDYMGDAVFSLSIMPNMIHCSSVIGIAREVAAYFNLPLKQPDISLPSSKEKIDGKVAVKICNAQLNPRFVLGLIKGVKVRQSPYWVQRRLKLAGMRPINAVVDATNYVMLESGQPLHAFDYDILVARADGKMPTIITRTARKGEKLTTLDGVEHQLDDFTELVCDTKGALSIAGVMGGEESEVTEKTEDVLLEGASWNFINIRRTVTAQRMQSEAAYRFARNLHPSLTELGVRLCLKRMAEWGGGSIADGLIDEYPNPYLDPTIKLSEADAERLLGVYLSAEKMAEFLTRLEYKCEVEGDKVTAKSPPYRTDVGEGVIGQADALEDVARLYGYEKINSTRLADELPPQRGNWAEERDRTIQDVLINMGLQEVVSYRLTSPQAEARIFPKGTPSTGLDYVELQNPIAEERRVMRRSLLASILEALERNIRHRERIVLFEIGPVFIPLDENLLPDEPQRLAIAMSGQRHPPAWDRQNSGMMDYFDLKGVIEGLLKALHIQGARFEASEYPSFHPGKCARLMAGEVEIGYLGELHPLVKDNYSFLAPPVLAAELDADALYRLAVKRFEAEAVSVYPPVIEDLAIIVNDEMPAAKVRETILRSGGFILKEAELFDLFYGEQIGAGNKSLAYRLTWQAPNRTLNDREVGKMRERVIQALEQELKAKVRKAE